MGMGYLAWAIVLILVALGLGFLELLLPSGGVLGFLTVVALVAAIVMAFQAGPLPGIVVLATTVVGVPTLVVLALRWWPHTPIGRRFLPPIPGGDEVLPDDADRRQLRDLVGRAGTAKSKMLPSGAVLIDGRTVDAVSEGVAIEAGQPIRVVQVRGMRVVVRPIDAASPPPEAARDDILSRPADSLGIDPDTLA